MNAAPTDTNLTEAELGPFRVAFGNLFYRVVVHPTGKRKPVAVTPYARIAAIMGVDIIPKMRTPKEVLEEQGLTSLVFGNPWNIGAAWLVKSEHYHGVFTTIRPRT